MNTVIKIRTYQGRVRQETVKRPERCALPDCRKLLSKDDRARNPWLCEAHTGLAVYVERLRASSAAARQRLLEAYPVCAGCGRKLTHEAVKAGRTRHERGEADACR